MATKEKVVEEVVEGIVENIDKAAEIVTEAVELVDVPKGWVCRLSRGQHLAQLIAVGVIFGGAAAFVTYKVVQKKLTLKFEEELSKEITEAKAFYGKLHKTDLDTPEKAGDKLLDKAVAAVKDYDPESENPEKVNVTTETSLNVFAESAVDEEFDLEAEMKNRDPLRPYIITDDEFMENEPDHQQVQYTYYEGDQTLADDEDTVIVDSDKRIGEANLRRFGHGSGDSKVVFIRNERLHTDFEIAKSDGKYAHEVAGLQHSDESTVERIRRGQARE